jgi:hypothetical protein
MDGWTVAIILPSVGNEREECNAALPDAMDLERRRFQVDD